MTQLCFPELLHEIVDNGIELTMIKQNNEILFDVNTGAKSELKLHMNSEGDTFTGHGRYGDTYHIETFDDLCDAVVSCMMGREHISHLWKALLVKNGHLRVVTKEHIVFD